MNSNFCVILLLYLSGVYCTWSTIENLDFDGFNRIMNGQTTINEWRTAINQNVIYEHPDGQKSTIYVFKNLLDFKQNGAVTDFQTIHHVIKLAYQCTITKYVSISTWLVFQDLSQLKINIHEAIRLTIAEETLASQNSAEDHSWEFDPKTISKNVLFKKKFGLLNYGKYYLDYDFKLNGDFELIFQHLLYDFKIKNYIRNFWSDMIEKTLGINIKYKIYTDVITTKFRNDYDQPFVDTVNELMCVLNEAFQMIDKFIVDKCVEHEGSFLKNFQSLANGVNTHFISVLNEFDKIITKSSSRFERYKDFTKSVVGTSPEIAAISASGCFVENLEFEVSGFKINLQNDMDPTKMYGHSFVERTSQINMKLLESTGNPPQGGKKIGMISFEAQRNYSDDHSQPLPDGPTR